MQPEFWLECWQNNKLGFQLDAVHPLLVDALGKLNLQESQVFVPLCGKSPDLLYLARYFHVIGNELSEIACRDFFTEHKLAVSEQKIGEFNCFTTTNISVLQGDFFALSKADITDIRLVYDRAALIALPLDMRQRYAAHLSRLIEPGGKIVLIALEYPEHEKHGPPFSVPLTELSLLFPGAKIDVLAEQDLTGQGFARRRFNTSSLIETLYLITLPV